MPLSVVLNEMLISHFISGVLFVHLFPEIESSSEIFQNARRFRILQKFRLLFFFDHWSRYIHHIARIDHRPPTPPSTSILAYPAIDKRWRSWCSYCLFPHVDISCVQRQYYKTAAYNILLTGSNPHAHATTMNIGYKTSVEWEGVVSRTRGTGPLRA